MRRRDLAGEQRGQAGPGQRPIQAQPGQGEGAVRALGPVALGLEPALEVGVRPQPLPAEVRAVVLHHQHRRADGHPLARVDRHHLTLADGVVPDPGAVGAPQVLDEDLVVQVQAPVNTVCTNVPGPPVALWKRRT